MGKKRTRTKKVSKGLRTSMATYAIRAVRADRNYADVMSDKLTAWRAGKNPWLTVANPNKLETNRLFYRVKANTYFGGSFKELKNRNLKREKIAEVTA